jgi:arabinan endo-1,5-alpha-L-arabinosidase
MHMNKAMHLLIVSGQLLAQEPPPSRASPQAPLTAPATEPDPRRRPWMMDADKVHDPSTIIGIDGVYRFFSTGPGITLMRENTEGRWRPEGRLFAEGALPQWHDEVVSGNRGYLWAPDVIRIGASHFVYYSVSAFGKNVSAIGLAVGRSLDPKSPDWKWEDRGPVLKSRASDRFNAIDPAIFRDEADGRLWMTFGSFWDGIFLVELDPKTGLRRESESPPLRLAGAPEIEAPFLHKHHGKYYLFVNWGKCCRGTNSTYEIRLGRSDQITGPFLDRSGKDLRGGGGTLLLAGVDEFIGPGHASFLHRNGQEWLAHHYYGKSLGGRSRLRLVRVNWDASGWPRVQP